MRKSSRRFARRRKPPFALVDTPGPSEGGCAGDAHPDEAPLEKEVQREVVKLYQALGCEVVSFSHPWATMQTEGIPDLRIYCRRKGASWWHESKRPGGKQSADQVRFQQLAEACGERYVLGGWEAAVEVVKELGLVAPEWRPARPLA